MSKQKEKHTEVGPNLAARLSFFSSSAASKTIPDGLTPPAATPAAGALVPVGLAGVDSLAAGATIPKRACRLLNTSAGIYRFHELGSKNEALLVLKLYAPDAFSLLPIPYKIICALQSERRNATNT